MNLQDKVIEDEEIHVIDGDIFNTIGPNVTLKRCVLKFAVPAISLGIRGTLIDSTIILEKELVGFSWLETTLDNCIFIGNMKENQFGRKTKGAKKVSSSDFVRANLDDCLFFGEGSDLHNFPKWPNFVILNPTKNLNIMRDAQNEDEIIEDIVSTLEYFDDQLRAVSFNANQLAEELGVSPNDVRESIKRFGFIVK